MHALVPELTDKRRPEVGKDRLFAIGLTLAVPLGLLTSACARAAAPTAKAETPKSGATKAPAPTKEAPKAEAPKPLAPPVKVKAGAVPATGAGGLFVAAERTCRRIAG